jgi:hypothetical protein
MVSLFVPPATEPENFVGVDGGHVTPDMAVAPTITAIPTPHARLAERVIATIKARSVARRR